MDTGEGPGEGLWVASNAVKEMSVPVESVARRGICWRRSDGRDEDWPPLDEPPDAVRKKELNEEVEVWEVVFVRAWEGEGDWMVEMVVSKERSSGGLLEGRLESKHGWKPARPRPAPKDGGEYQDIIWVGGLWKATSRWAMLSTPA